MQGTEDQVELVETIAVMAEQLRQEVVQERVGTPPYREIQEVRRALQTLEQRYREGQDSAVGDAC
jgi:hypothetical protein